MKIKTNNAETAAGIIRSIEEQGFKLKGIERYRVVSK